MFSGEFIRSVFTKLPPHTIGFRRISTDSRSIQTGDLFAAIKGEKFDGHDYIFEVSKKGAAGALVSRTDFPKKAELPKDFLLIEVKDPTEALRKLAKAYRRRLKIPIFAVAGSNGKTTTKEWLWFLLSKLHPGMVFKTEKSQNSILGIALSILQISDEKMAVIEIGIDEPGWMDQHLEVVAPTHGLITTIAEEHLNRLKNIKTVAKEELKLLDYLIKRRGGFAANQDSKWIKGKALPKNSLTYALAESAEIEGLYEAPQVLHAFGIAWQNPLPGKHNAENLLAAITAVRLLHPEITQEELATIAKETKKFEGEAHRSRLITLKDDIRIYDDCYNANPDSMENALQAFTEIAAGCRQHFVLGDMLDLGKASEKSHQRILNLALVLGHASTGADRIYLIGPEFKTALYRITPKPKNTQHFSTLEDLAKALNSNLKPTDMIFLKGSRGMSLERLIPHLKK